MFRSVAINWVLLGSALLATCDAATVKIGPTRDWHPILSGNGLRPGDEIILREGVYTDRRRLQLSHRGTKEKPIIIRAQEGAKVTFQRPDNRDNTFNLVGAQYVQLRGFEITGGSSGIRIRSDGRNQPVGIVLEGLHIHHIDGSGITCNNPGSFYQQMTFRGNHIHHTSGHGEGFYLGCNNDKNGRTLGYIFDSIIEGNYIHDLNGKKISQGDGIEIKDGSYGNTVRDNVIHDTNYPGILVYGTDGKAPNIIERNVIWNTQDHAIQAGSDAIIRNNVIFDSNRDGIHSKKHQSAIPGNLQILNNTVVRGRSGIRISPAAGGLQSKVVIANNAIFSSTALYLSNDQQLEVKSNCGSGRVYGRQLEDSNWLADAQLEADLDLNFVPTANSKLVGRADERLQTELDFDARKRGDRRYVGAREPGTVWRISPAFKTIELK